MLNPWLALALLLAAQMAWVLVVRLLSTWLEAERSRKLFHSGSGVILLSLPYLFDELWPVVLWGVLSLGSLALISFRPELRSRFAGNVYDVGRVSYGDFYFVLGVVLLYFFASPTPYTYVVPLTLLAFADTAGALVGKRFGVHKYEATEGRKSIEGSAAFFSVAFISTLVWLPLLPNAVLSQVLLIAVILGFVVMLLEAIAWRGLDNLLIPLGSFILLRTYLTMSLTELWLHLAVAAGLVGFMLLWRRRTTLNDSALITGALFGYLAWTVPGKLFGASILGLAGWAWLLMPAATFLAYNLVFAPKLLERHEVHNVDAVFSAIFAGAVWLYLAFYYLQPNFLFPYAVSFAAVVLNMWLEQRMVRRRLAGTHEVGYSAIVGVAMVAAAGILLVVAARIPESSVWWVSLLLAGAAAAGVLVALGLRVLAEGPLLVLAPRDWRWHVRAVASLVGSAVAALALIFVELGQS